MRLVDRKDIQYVKTSFVNLYSELEAHILPPIKENIKGHKTNTHQCFTKAHLLLVFPVTKASFLHTTYRIVNEQIHVTNECVCC